MEANQLTAVSQIVSAIIAKGFDKETDGVDLLFDGGSVVLVDAEGQRMSLRTLISYVSGCLE